MVVSLLIRLTNTVNVEGLLLRNLLTVLVVSRSSRFSKAVVDLNATRVSRTGSVVLFR